MHLSGHNVHWLAAVWLAVFTVINPMTCSSHHVVALRHMHTLMTMARHQDLSCMYLAHHELESVIIMIMLLDTMICTAEKDAEIHKGGMWCEQVLPIMRPTATTHKTKQAIAALVSTEARLNLPSHCIGSTCVYIACYRHCVLYTLTVRHTMCMPVAENS